MYLVIKRYGDYFLQLAITFIALVGVAATLTRSGFGVWQATSSRYSMFPLLALACAYIVIVTSVPKTSAACRVVLVSAVLCAMSLWGFGIIHLQRTHYFLTMKDERIAGIVAFRNGDTGRLLYSNKERAAQILLTAEQQHIYNYQVQTH
jgi:hypothetical protein